MAAGSHEGIPGRSKAEFLGSVRDALGRSEGPPVQRYHRLEEDLPTLEARASEMETRLRSLRPQLLDRLADMAGKGGWNVHRVSGAEAAWVIDPLFGEVGATLGGAAPDSPYS